MTAEQITLLESSDLRAMRMVCTKCRGSLSIYIDETFHVPDKCPACGFVWRAEEHYGTPTAAETVGKALKAWIQSERDKNPPFVLRFEITRP